MALVSKAFGDIITFTRASTATYFDATGTLQSAAIDVPRFDYDPSTLAARGFLIEEARTNSIRNNTMQGAVAGTPGTLPTNWSGAAPAVNVIGTGIENGITYVDLQVVGTTGATSGNLAFETITATAAASGQTWTNSVYIRLVAGSFTNVSQVRVNMQGYTSASASNADAFNSTDIISSLSATNISTNRRTVTGTLADATTAYIRPRLFINWTNGAAVDFTLRIGLPQLEQGAFATSVIPTTTTALTRSADVASVNTLSPWFNATEGTFVAQSLVTSGATSFVSRFIGAATNIYMANGYVAGSGTPTAASYLRNGAAAAQISTAIGTKVAGTVYKEATRYSSTSFREAANGTLGNDITPSAGIPTVSKLDFAASAGSLTSTAVGQLWLQRFTYYPRSFSDAELTSISA